MIVETRALELRPQFNVNNGIISEFILEFTDNSRMAEATCSCVCINDEKCCGCIME